MSEIQYRVEHIGLPAQDPAGLKDWYVRVLDAELVFDNGMTPPAYYIRLLDGAMLEIYKASYSVDAVSDNNCRGWRHLALLVDSLDQAKEALMKRGVMFPNRIRPAGGGGSVLFFQDPEGNLLHLLERSQNSPILASAQP